MVDQITIAGRTIGTGHPCFIIAEAGVNHNGSLDLARQLVDVAAEAKADAVKFQTYKTESVISRMAPKATYQLETTDSGQSQFEMSKGLELPQEAFRQLMAYCHEREIMFLSSPFDEESVDFLAEIGVAAIKIPSGEITNLPYLARAARHGKPLIVSTGMANLSEVETAVNTIEGSGNKSYVLLHCVSNYPADPANVNLRAMATLRSAFSVPVGYSDHTPGLEVTIAAVSMGASVIEKHFTLDSDMPGPDHRASLEPDELAAMIRNIRTVESAMGDGRKVPAGTEANTADVARKSLVAAQFIPAGTVLTEELIAIKRPGTGYPTAMFSSIVGRATTADIVEDELFSPENTA